MIALQLQEPTNTARPSLENDTYAGHISPAPHSHWPSFSCCKLLYLVNLGERWHDIAWIPADTHPAAWYCSRTVCRSVNDLSKWSRSGILVINWDRRDYSTIDRGHDRHREQPYSWPSSVQNKIKILFDSYTYSSKAQNTTCTVWLLGYKYFVHFSVWTKCLSDGVENANTRTLHKFLKNFLNDADVTQQKFILQLVI